MKRKFKMTRLTQKNRLKTNLENVFLLFFFFLKIKKRGGFRCKPKFRDMDISLEFVFYSFGLDNPLVSPIPVLMNKLSGVVIVQRVNLILCVLNIRTVYLKALNEHVFFC